MGYRELLRALFFVMALNIFVVSCVPRRSQPPEAVTKKEQLIFLEEVKKRQSKRAWALFGSNPWTSKMDYAWVFEDQGELQHEVMRDGKLHALRLDLAVESSRSFLKRVEYLNSVLLQNYDSGALDSTRYEFLYVELENLKIKVIKRLELNPAANPKHEASQLVRHLFLITLTPK